MLAQEKHIHQYVLKLQNWIHFRTLQITVAYKKISYTVLSLSIFKSHLLTQRLRTFFEFMQRENCHPNTC